MRYNHKKSGRISDAVLDTLYPRHCPFCGDILEKGYEYHEKCIKNTKIITGKRCVRCSRPLDDFSEHSICEECRHHEYSFEKEYAVFEYDDIMRRAMSKLKFNGCKEYGIVFGKICAYLGKNYIVDVNPDIIVPIPLHPKKYRKRGYNQASVIADEISNIYGIKLAENAVLRIKETEALKNLNANIRMKTVLNAFGKGTEDVGGKTVLIVDDIFTTGSTVDGVSRVLKSMGASKTYALTVCIGRSFMVN